MKPTTALLTQHEYHYLHTLLSEKEVEASKHTPPSEDPSHLFRADLLKRLGTLLFQGEIVLLPGWQWDKVSTDVNELAEDLDFINEYINQMRQ